MRSMAIASRENSVLFVINSTDHTGYLLLIIHDRYSLRNNDAFFAIVLDTQTVVHRLVFEEERERLSVIVSYRWFV